MNILNMTNSTIQKELIPSIKEGLIPPIQEATKADSVGIGQALAGFGNKILDLGAAAVGKIAEVMKEAAPKVWEVFMRQQVVHAMEYGVWVVFNVALSIYTIRLVSKLRKMDPEKWERKYGPPIAVPIILLYIVFTICILVATCMFINMMKYIINPEFYAIQEIATTVQVIMP